MSDGSCLPVLAVNGSSWLAVKIATGIATGNVTVGITIAMDISTIVTPAASVSSEAYMLRARRATDGSVPAIM